MKRLILVGALSISLTGCGLETNGTLSEQIAQVQNYTKQICSYLPTVTSVTGMVTAADPVVTGAFEIAKAICHAIEDKTVQSLLGDCPKVNGVCVEGERVK